jgi:hypothetical protein
MNSILARPPEGPISLRINANMVWSVFRMLLEPLVRILDVLGGDMKQLEFVAAQKRDDDLMGTVLNTNCKGFGATAEPFIRYQKVQIV